MVDPDNRQKLWGQLAETSAQAFRALQEEVRLQTEFQRRAYAEQIQKHWGVKAGPDRTQPGEAVL
jgi:hypothetical protein